MAFCLATGLAKSSILLFYLRIFPSKRLHIAVWIMFVITFGTGFGGVFVELLSCNPVAGNWELRLATTAHCINKPVVSFLLPLVTLHDSLWK